MLIQPSVSKSIYEIFDEIPEMHRNIFRGKDLGTSFTDEQKAAIKDGSFHDIFVGDYWRINGHTWRVADINYWYWKGNYTYVRDNHVNIIPDRALYTARFLTDSENSNNVGYGNSDLHNTGLEQAKKLINNAFGESYVLEHEATIITRVDQCGYYTAWSSETSTVEILDEPEYCGSHINTRMSAGKSETSGNQSLLTTNETSIALFQLCPEFAWGVYSYWLSDMRDNKMACYVYQNQYLGYKAFNGADNAYVRPIVGITGGA